MPRNPRPRPVDLVSPWPKGRTSDSAGRVAASFARSLGKAIDERDSVRAAAIECGLNHQTLHAILNGEVWPDMYTIAKLESGLGLQLWPTITSVRD
jgi:hypothetical protein